MSYQYADNPKYDTYLGGLESERAIRPGTLRSMMMTESAGDSSAVSRKGARGLFQFMGPTARQYGLQDPHDPQEAGRVAADYFAYLLNQFGDEDTAKAAYNFGEGNVRAGKPWPKETRDYVKQVNAGIPDPRALAGLSEAWDNEPAESPAPGAPEGEDPMAALSAAFDQIPGEKPVPKSDKGFFESIGPGFREHKGLTENIVDLATGVAPRGPEPKVDRGFAESAGRMVGMVGKEIVDPVGLGLMLVPPARVAVGATAKAAMIARTKLAAKLGGGYELAAGAAEQQAEKGLGSGINVGELATRTLIGAAAGPILEEGVRAVGKGVGNAWTRYRGAKDTQDRDLVNKAVEGEGKVDDAEWDPYAEEEVRLPPPARTDEAPGTEGVEVEEIAPEEISVGPEDWESVGRKDMEEVGMDPAEIEDIIGKGKAERAESQSIARPEFQSFSHDLEDVISNPKSPGAGTADAAYKRIEETAESPWQKKIAKQLRKLNLGTTIRMRGSADLQVLDPRTGEAVEAMGQFWRKQNIIDVHTGFLDEGGVAMGARGMSRTIIHEGMHAGTHLAIDSGGTVARKWSELYTYANDMTRGMERAGTAPKGASKQYGWADEHEFAAEGFSNPDFQKVLKEIPALNPTGKIRTLWDQFRNTVRISLGLPPNTPKSVLDEVIEGGLDLMKLQKKMTPRQKFAAGMTKAQKAQLDDWAKGMAGDIRAKQIARGMDPKAAERAYRGNYVKLRQQAVDQYRKDSEGAPEEFAEAAKLPGGPRLGAGPVPQRPDVPPGADVPVQSLASKVAQAISPLTGGRSIRQLDPKSKSSATLRELRDQIEHRQEFELKAGETAAPDFTEKVLQMTGTFTTALGKVFDTRRTGFFQSFSNEARKQLAMEIRAGAVTPAAKQIRKILDDVHAYAKAAGLDIGYVENYFPRMYRMDVLRGKEGGTAFKRVLEDYGVDPTDAEDILRRITAEEGFDIRTYNNSKTNRPGSPNWKKSRALLEIPDGALERFLHNDPRTVLNQYTSHVVRRAEHAKIFGPNGEKLDSAFKQINAELGTKGQSLTVKEETFIRGLSQALIGRYNPILTRGLQTATRMVSSYQLIRTLPLAVLSSLSEPFIALERGGIKAFSSGLLSGIGYAGKQAVHTIFRGTNKAKSRLELEEYGLIADNSLADTLREAGSGMTRLMQADDQSIGALRSGKWVDLFFKANMLEPWTNFTRSIALGTGKKSLRDTIEGFSRNQGGVMAKRLRELGLDGNEAAAWFKRTDGDFTVVDPYQGSMKTALTRFVNDVVMMPRAATKPLWMSDPHLHLVAQLKSYQTTFGNTVGRRWFENMKRAGKSPEDLAKAAYTVGTAGVMTYAASLSNDLRERYMYGPKGNPRLRRESGASETARAMDRAGLTGGLQPAIDLFWGERFGKPGAVQALGPTATQAVDVIEGVHGLVKKGDPKKLAEAGVEALPGYFGMPSKMKKDVMRDTQRTTRRVTGKVRRRIRRLKRAVKRAL